MSHHDKGDFWQSQFQQSLPMMIARWFVRENEGSIRRDLMAVDPVKVAEYSRGKYGREEIGAYLVRHQDYMAKIFAIIHQPGPTEIMCEQLKVDRPSPGFTYWNHVRRTDPQHPALGGAKWSIALDEELAAVIGGHITTKWKDDFSPVMKQIRQEASKFKTVSGVMDA